MLHEAPDYPSMGGSAKYRIRVHGRLTPQLSGRLENMSISNLSRDDGEVESVLEGILVDQSAFAGVLKTLYELHLPVISADCLGVVKDGQDKI